MRVLYIFPHPDDESFGPAPAIARQKREGHDVFLLTLTKGGATKERFKLGYSVEQMGDLRLEEMQNVSKVLDLNGMTVLDLPDTGLKEMDPRLIEKVVQEEIEKVKPDVVVTYPVHGVSGFHDHIISHHIVKRVFLVLREKVSYLKRLAFYTLDEISAKRISGHIPLQFSTPEDIDCVQAVEGKDLEKFEEALACYKSYQDVIKKSKVREKIGNEVHFELFQESFAPPLQSLFDAMQA